MLDCLIIGAGPAGLVAATYLGRFRRRFAVIDGGGSRAAWIPVSRNIPGFPDGISGLDLLAHLRDQAARYGGTVRPATVETLEQVDGHFVARIGGEVVEASRVLLATGGEDISPELPGISDAVRRGLLRHCPICDAHEVIGQRVALIGYGKCRVPEAMLLRSYTADVTVLTLGRRLELREDEARTLREAGVRILEDPLERIAIEGEVVTGWHMRGGTEHRFDTVYSALGTRVRSDLALALGAEADADGALLVDGHQRSSVPGLWAAGDVASGLSQVSVAAGQAAVAATDINRSLPFPRAGKDGAVEEVSPPAPPAPPPSGMRNRPE
ncbi:MAG TPA: NAD(P)/FAD-dependent oxidoreductase [Acetobacteraceae bacterium]